MLTFEGSGVVNTLINKLPFELHLPGKYQYCGPGTKLQRRLTRGDPGINLLDQACKEHDIAYSQSEDLQSRHEADRILQERAWKRVEAPDAKFSEKAAAWIVSNIMKVKRKLGMGLNQRHRLHHKVPFKKTIFQKAKKSLKHFKMDDIKKGAKLSLAAGKLAVKDVGGRRNVRTPRIIPIPKTGGFLPLIPLFAGLSALGGLAGGAAGIAQAVNKAKAAQRQLDEAQRHNKVMETVALGKKGEGLYLKPYRKGMGLFLKPQRKNH